MTERARRVPLVVGAALGLGLSCSSEPSVEPSVDAGQPPSDGLTDDARKLLDDPDLDPGLRSLILGSAVFAAPETNLDAIEAARAAGDISDEQARVFRIFAVLEPDRLPEAYRLAPPESGRGFGWDLHWFMDRWDRLSPERQAELQAYVLPPDHADSFFNPVNRPEIDGTIPPLMSSSALRTADVILPHWEAEPTQNNEAIVHYFVAFSEAWEDEMNLRAGIISDAIEQSWPKFAALIGTEPARPIHVYYTVIADDADGEAYMIDVGGDRRCRMDVSLSNWEDEDIQGTTAHELFHCFQLDGVDLEYSGSDKQWLMESTATWSEHFAYPAGDTEHGFLSAFYGTLANDRLKYAPGLDDPYGSYVFWYFAARYWQSDQVVPDVLWRAKSEPVRAIVDDRIPVFDDAHEAFAVRSVNVAPTQYEDVSGALPGGPSGASLLVRREAAPREGAETLTVDKGGVRYAAHVFNQSPVKMVEFDFGGPTHEHLGRQALIKRLGDPVWHHEDWGEQERVVLCLDDDEGRISAILVIASNADLLAGDELSYGVRTRQDCGVGYTRVTEQWDNLLGYSRVRYYSQDTVALNPDAQADTYRLTSRYATYNSYFRQEVMGLETIQTGTGTLTESYADGPWKFHVDRGAKTGAINLDPPSDREGWVSWRDTEGTEYLLTRPSFFHDTHVYDLTPDEILDDRIKGYRTLPVPGGQVIIEFEYAY